jgi:glutamine---fructose-6-phosphate transaminase (isomerizing)
MPWNDRKDMKPDSPYALVKEMLEAPRIIGAFDRSCISSWAAAAARKRLLITGEGSSRIFPAKNMIDLARRRGLDWHICTEGARQAAEYPLENFTVIGVSNSGRTRELVELFEQLEKKGQHRYGITATAGSRLTEVSSESRVLRCGPEKAVPATKSVVEQALTCQSLLGGAEWEHQAQAAEACAAILAQDVPPAVLDRIAKAPFIYFAGRNNGVAEELALKTNEIARRKSAYLEGTYVLHGIEEVMTGAEAVVLVEPFRAEIEKYQRILESGVGIGVVAISSFDTPFPTIRIPSVAGFDGYLQLMAGWNILVAMGLAGGIDLDRPQRARKVGNEI